MGIRKKFQEKCQHIKSWSNFAPNFYRNSLKPDSGKISKITFAGLLITLGIVYGDIGTSPLYVMKAILLGANGAIDQGYILGALSCIIWTLTLQTTVKYVLVTLKADNHGEGGIFALYALVRKKRNWIFIPAAIGGAALLADGVITPAITVLSSVEGIRLSAPNVPVIPITLLILMVLFMFQQFGTSSVGKTFGPVMFVWFSMLAFLGVYHVIQYPDVFRAINPVYAIKLLANYPGGFAILGAVFLCTTGAEALYSDLGHVGFLNIRITWVFVKISLILNYLGQGAWILHEAGNLVEGVNPFYAVMPDWFLVTGVAISAAAAVIASQALITGSYTIISEAISLNFWPRVKIKYPAELKGQMYIPSVNWFLFLACCFVVLYFQESSNMEAAYGLAITLTMIMTSLLMIYYLRKIKRHVILVAGFIIVYFIIEGSFLIANLQKFSHGGWFTVLLAGILFFIMFVWYRGRIIKKRFLIFNKIASYESLLRDLQKDETIPKFATNLVFLTRANYRTDVESKILYSIFQRQPKRADHYWLLHLNIVEEPNKLAYKVEKIIPGVLTKIDLHIGFKIQPRVNLFFRQVIEDMITHNEVDTDSHYESLRKHHISGDFRFVLIDRIQNYDFDFKPFDQFIMNVYNVLKRFGISDVKAFGLDSSNTVVELVPLENSEIIDRSKKMYKIDRLP
jgi:KUP system potassium uptake protein